MALRDLKSFKSDTITLEEAVSLSTEARTLRLGFESHGVSIPEWLDEINRELTRLIEAKRTDQIAMRKSEIRSTLASLESAADKRARLKAELDALEGAPVTSAPPAPVQG